MHGYMVYLLAIILNISNAKDWKREAKLANQRQIILRPLTSIKPEKINQKENRQEHDNGKHVPQHTCTMHFLVDSFGNYMFCATTDYKLNMYFCMACMAV
jgi:hypothetical protein